MNVNVPCWLLCLTVYRPPGLATDLAPREGESTSWYTLSRKLNELKHVIQHQASYIEHTAIYLPDTAHASALIHLKTMPLPPTEHPLACTYTRPLRPCTL